MFEDQSSIVGPGVATITLIRRKILANAVDEVSETMPMHVAPPDHTDCCGTRRSDSPVRSS
jgi:hypothetical protein